ncbi:formylglycine-generating enzyme family protein, partial [Klebsiella sp. K4-74]|uniref:formylglycine-generating enzyme family protein n=1 Tax=Klebsiella sp. K4-74 TaxID=2920180 RepID=UPI0024DDFFF2
GKNSLNRLIRCVCGKKIGPDPRNFNQRVSLGRNDLLIRTFPNNGEFSPGKNVPSQDELNKYTDGMGLPIYPVGKYPSNPLGLYDMGLSGSEWTNDWYAADYYSNSPVKNPQGPEQGTEKVLRGNVGGDRQYALTMFRQSASPLPEEVDGDYEKYGVGPQYVFRCVINK